METPKYTEARVWEAIGSLTEKQAETDRILTEKFAEVALQHKETEQAIKETQQSINKLDQMVTKFTKNWNKTLGKWDNSRGAFAEHYFLNAFKHGEKTFFGEPFDYIKSKLQGPVVGYIDEYDIVLINGKSIGIIEVKYQPHENTIAKIIRKADTFRVNFPYYANHQIFLGFASLVFPPDLEDKFTAEGIAVIKQIGKLVVIVDKNRKVF
jgi:hypothetical protein